MIQISEADFAKIQNFRLSVQQLITVYEFASAGAVHPESITKFVDPEIDSVKRALDGMDLAPTHLEQAARNLLEVCKDHSCGVTPLDVMDDAMVRLGKILKQGK